VEDGCRIHEDLASGFANNNMANEAVIQTLTDAVDRAREQLRRVQERVAEA
jgi:hypothetical protein